MRIGRSVEVSVGLGRLLVGLLVTLLVSVVLAVLHEALHGVVMLAVGARPGFGMGTESGAAFLYATAPGHRFTRGQYAVVALAPMVVLGGGLLVWMVWGSWAGWLVLPATLHLAGCAGDLIILREVLREPAGTLVEDRQTGAAFYPPDG